MRHEVIVTEPALDDAKQYADFISKRSHDRQASDQWWNGLLDAILSLEHLPGRCPRIPEPIKSASRIHQLIYHSHRIIFRIKPGLVTVVRIYHSSKRPLTDSSLRRH